MTVRSTGLEARGARGACAAGHPLAAQAGLAALQRGGNAVDACLAAAAVSWVAMPDMCGPGGDLLILLRAPDGSVTAINGTGRAPLSGYPPPGGAGRTMHVLVPGLPFAYERLAANYGRLGLAELLRPAADLAAAGFALSEMVDRQLKRLPADEFRTELLAAWGTDAPQAGHIVRWPSFAATLESWADGGSLAILEAAAEDWRGRGVAMEASDLRCNDCSPEEPLALSFGRWQVYGQPPLSQSIATLAALAMVGQDTVAASDGEFREHMLIEAYKSVYGHVRTMGDDDNARDLCGRLLDADFVRQGREAIGPRAAEGSPMPRNYGETTQCAASDAEGWTVSLIQSLYRPFGARVLSPRTGLIANDRGASFSDGANAPGPGRRPRHTLGNVIAVDADGSSYALGTPGAEAQPQTVLQCLTRLMRDPRRPLDAIVAPRWSYIGDGRVAVEASWPLETLSALEARGHALALRPALDWLMGSVSLAGHGRDGCIAVADHRRAALALAC